MSEIQKVLKIKSTESNELSEKQLLSIETRLRKLEETVEKIVESL